MFKKVLMCVLAVGVVLLPMVVRAQEAEPKWTGSVFFGYNQTNGNTKKGSGSLDAQAVRKMESAELTLKGSIYYSESNSMMDGQKWNSLAKYSFDFGDNKDYYNFYQVYVDHDYFADIDYRITPSTGLGYHISKTEDWMWDVDAGLGYRITRYRSNNSSDDDAATALAHTFMKKRIIEKAFLSEDFTVYPGLKSDSGVLLKSETVFSNPISESLDLQLKYIVDHNTEPGVGKKKTDTQFVAGVNYKF